MFTERIEEYYSKSSGLTVPIYELHIYVCIGTGQVVEPILATNIVS